MKILMVTRENPADKRYGLNKSLAPLMTEIQRRGIAIGYLCQTDTSPNSLTWLRSLHKFLVKLVGHFFSTTEFIPLLWGILERLNMGRLAAKVMAKDHYTHVHCHDPIIAAGYRGFARLRWFAQLRRGHTARWGVTEHGFGCYAEAFHIDGARLGTRTMHWLRRWEAKILRKAHWVMTPTQSGLIQLARDLAIYPIPASWYAIRHPTPKVNHYPKEIARQHLGWNNTEIYLITVGRFAPLKQFPAVLEACAQLPKLPWRLVFLGEGDSTSLQTLAAQLGVTEKISFAVSDDIGWYYSAADIYVSTSLTESFGLANLEAVISGLPAICTAVGGVPEVVGNAAYLIPAQDPQALKSALRELIENAETRHQLSQRAHQWAQRWPTADLVTDAYLAMYQGRPLPELTSPLELPPLLLETWHQQINQWQLCPLPKALELPKQAKILMIAPHPDDETLGCGGTLTLLKQRGCQIKIVIITDGHRGDPSGYLAAENIIQRRQQESLAALDILGIKDVVFLDQPDGCYQHTSQIASQLSQVLENYVADWLLIPSVLDYHRDHVGISLSMLDLWQQRGCRERLFLYETWGTIPATWVVDITAVFVLKQQATQCYELPLKYCDYLTACTGMANYRGLYLPPPNRQAEAFLELTAVSWRSVVTYLLRIREYQERVLS